MDVRVSGNELSNWMRNVQQDFFVLFCIYRSVSFLFSGPMVLNLFFTTLPLGTYLLFQGPLAINRL